MRGQLAEMKTSSIIAKRQLRAKMKLTLTFGHNVINKKIVEWTVTPDWANIGQTDAISWAAWDAAGFFPGNKANQFDFVADITTGHWKKNVYNVPLGEGVSQATQFIPRTDAENALAGAGIIIVWGYITWKDIFPDSPTHFRHWCFRYVPTRANGDIAFAEPVIYRPECNRAE